MKLKQILIIVLFIGNINLSQAKGNHPVEELFPLPHPMKLIMPNKGKLNITTIQEEKLNKEMMSISPPQIHEKMNAAKILEDSLFLAVTKEGKNKNELKSDIDKLAKIKRELVDIHIDALNTLRNILTDEQRVLVKELMHEAKNKAKECNKDKEEHKH